jgi:uncharacterized protein
MQVFVALDEISDKGRDLIEPLPIEYLAKVLDGFGHATGYRPRNSATLRAHFARTSGAFELTGNLTAALVGECKRCLSPVELDVPVAFRLNLVQAPRVTPRADGASPLEADHKKGTFELEDADQEVVEGGVVDVLDVVREQILLALPPDTLCSETCLGLCSRCGKNLNEGECACSGPQPDPRWAALQRLKLH